MLDDPDLNLMEQTETQRKQTLGDFVKRLKRRVKLEPKFKDDLYRFLNMRNTFVHNLSEAPGWDMEAPEGRVVARKFMTELAVRSITITAIFTTLFSVSAKDEYGGDLFKEGQEIEWQIVGILEKHIGATARKV